MVNGSGELNFEHFLGDAMEEEDWSGSDPGVSGELNLELFLLGATG